MNYEKNNYPLTLYILDLENTEDAIFYQHLKDLQVNIISMNPQSQIMFKANESLAQETKTIAKTKVRTHITITANMPSRYALDNFCKQLFYLYDKYLGKYEDMQKAN